MNIEQLMAKTPIVEQIRAAKEVFWVNPGVCPFDEIKGNLPLTASDIDDAEARLARFAPFIAKKFPETALLHGMIESPLTDVGKMKDFLNETCGAGLTGRLLLKLDSHLAVSGSVKARGGIYEVLKHSEDLALANNLLHGDYTVFDSEEARAFFGKYAIHVGSTGNLGLSIGIMGAALGYRTTVHMSADAKEWKKNLLRSKGVTVVEYESDYSLAVQEGRKLAAEDPFSYFVDDENSAALFLGYSVAARRLKRQLSDKEIAVDASHPLLVYLPCGVGGAPGGVAFGLKHEFGDHVFCFFVEPTQAPCMLLGLATGLHNEICVQDVGLTGKTEADGLAVGRPSKFVGKTVEKLVSGAVTVDDEKLFAYLRGLLKTEGVFIEPSACAAFHGAVKLREAAPLLAQKGLTEERLRSACHIVWATGGSMVPEAERQAAIKAFRP
ncbi:MAG: D-serine ammonia-lyase [Schwartzia sp.]|nr:D-serine ammonia-lyase [Schwartzia sp. (in: firmicutes)]